ncbi:ArsO family NAD(P)H-dependent flavin-containing monooxygenase [Cesiribacter sp. SM1]|uniref:ArsO family NAD(P)H-dependent flavin-containing monooxygenase n=1 Tax=Cesiribacter sp. SM1 TaxID=2861196 RepID=UPI001CD7615E|nr:ArsO family NAD(P)H-dependent flavin-containing monooxygenase [Cesiribacter sp. SM1]
MYDTIVIGGGQSALATAYFLRREGLEYLLLDKQPAAGGAWQQYWESLRLFSPADASSLPGWLMPRSEHTYPSRNEVVSYLQQYEERYKIPVERPVQVTAVHQEGAHFLVQADQEAYQAKTIVSATGSFQNPYIPPYPGRELFRGVQIHAAAYQNPEPFRDKKVLVVGGGNSGAQILAELSKTAHTTWVTENEPSFLPDDVDGRYLFSIASKIWEAKKRGETFVPRGSLGDIVLVEPVKEARERGALLARRPFNNFTEEGVRWPDGTTEYVDAVIWCTGYRPALEHLAPLAVLEADGKVLTRGTRSQKVNGLWLVGYGSWTGFASATLIGVGRSSRQTAAEIKKYLQQDSHKN